MQLNRKFSTLVRLGVTGTAFLALTGCGSERVESDPGTVSDRGEGERRSGDSEQDPNPFRFEVWHDDFPFPVPLPKRVAGRLYDRTPRQALQSILEKVAGRGSKNAYRFAGQFLDRVDEDDLELVIEELGEALSDPGRATDAENLLDALAESGSKIAADAAVRALDHRDPQVRSHAMSTVGRTGDAADLRQAWRVIPELTGRGALAWIRAAAEKLPAEESVPLLRSLADQRSFEPALPQLIEAVLVMDPNDRLSVFQNFERRDFDVLRVPMAIWRYQAGAPSGESDIRNLIRHEQEGVRAEVLRWLADECSSEQIKPFIDLLFEQVATEPAPSVRTALVDTLAAIDDPSVDDSIETLAFDRIPAVRRRALFWLGQRGAGTELDELVRVVETGTGTTARSALEELVYAQYPAALPAMNRRMLSEEPADRGDYLRALCLTTLPEAIEFVRPAFFSDWISEDLMRRVSIWMANLAGAEFVVLEMFDECPTGDLLRRALLLRTMTAMAGVDTESGREFRAPLRERLRQLLRDSDEVPQLRLFALDELKGQFELGDIQWLSRLARSSEPSMGAALNSFLFEYF